MRRNTVFSQIMQLICRYRFKECVDTHAGDRYTKTFSCWQQLLVLLFAQAKGRTSLRDIVLSLRSHREKWYHLGLTSVARSTLADANNKRNADIFKDVFMPFWKSVGNYHHGMALSLRIHCIHSIRRLSTCVCRSTLGRPIGRRKVRLNFIPCSITQVICHRSWCFQTGKPTI